MRWSEPDRLVSGEERAMQNANKGVRLLVGVLLLPAVWLATFAIAGAALGSPPVPAAEDNERICGR